MHNKYTHLDIEFITSLYSPVNWAMPASPDLPILLPEVPDQLHRQQLHYYFPVVRASVDPDSFSRRTLLQKALHTLWFFVDEDICTVFFNCFRRNIYTIPGKTKQLTKSQGVCVRNKANRKEWLAFICTDMTLSEEEIIRIYGKRWQIEVFFKTCKSMLNLIGECHSLSYDALTAHVSIVFTRYMLLAMEQRQNEFPPFIFC